MKKFALLIGVSDYPEGLPELPAATQDIAALQRVLADSSLGGFEVQLLANPLRDSMAKEIELWLRQRQADELALLFFSGHGLKDERRELYFAAANTQKDNGQLITSTALRAADLQGYLRYGCKAKQQIVILDCCFSGAFGEFVPRDDGELPLQAQLLAEGSVVLTSTSAVDYAFETKSEELSIYTRYLVEGIEKGSADLDGDGHITVDELHDFASRKVKETAPAMAPDIITLEGRGHRIQLARTPQDKPELRYRKEVEKRVKQGQLTLIARRLLKSLQRQCGLADEVAKAIENEVLKPHRDFQRKRLEYREALAECLEPIRQKDPAHITDLKDYQKHLGLKGEDVADIERELVGFVINPAEVPAATTQGAAAKVAKPSAQPSTSQHSTFRFETVRVNERGDIVETLPGEAEVFTQALGNGVSLEMVRIPGGKFLMGAAEGEEGASKDEYPQHEVTVPEFWMGKFAVTQAQWAAVAAMKEVERALEADPAHFKGERRPVEQVSWQDAMEFCQRLSRHAGTTYSLPSEAQWEYACRAGTTTPFHYGPTITPELANFDGNYTYAQAPKGEYRKQTLEVGGFKPNGFGLYDMHGNVWEWCLDDWHGSYEGAPTDGSAWISSGERKLLRGGSWRDGPSYCRAAYRAYDSLDDRDDNIGFRVLLFAPRT